MGCLTVDRTVFTQNWVELIKFTVTYYTPIYLPLNTSRVRNFVVRYVFMCRKVTTVVVVNS